MKTWVGILSVIVLVVGIWMFAVYGNEFLTDTKNWVEDNFVTETEKDNTTNDENNENPETEGDQSSMPDFTARINATGNLFLIN